MPWAKPIHDGDPEIPWNLMSSQNVCYRSIGLCSEVPDSMECAMNIFYIIGVVVVIIFVAGFFGLHV